MFGPLEFNRRDLMAVNIQRGRDHGVPDFNTVRKYYGLPEKSYEELIPDFDSNLSSDDKERVCTIAKFLLSPSSNNLTISSIRLMSRTYFVRRARICNLLFKHSFSSLDIASSL